MEMSAVRRRTDREIRESFIRLLETKPINKITVQDLCSEAEINRATFYRYYTDIYALYDSITESFFKQLFTDIVAQRSDDAQGGQGLRASILKALDLIESRKSLCYSLFHDADSIFGFKLISGIENLVTESDNMADPLSRVRINYMCGGIMTVMLTWIRNNCETDKDIIAEAIELGMRELLH